MLLAAQQQQIHQNAGWGRTHEPLPVTLFTSANPVRAHQATLPALNSGEVLLQRCSPKRTTATLLKRTIYKWREEPPSHHAPLHPRLQDSEAPKPSIDITKSAPALATGVGINQRVHSNTSSSCPVQLPPRSVKREKKSKVTYTAVPHHPPSQILSFFRDFFNLTRLLLLHLP